MIIRSLTILLILLSISGCSDEKLVMFDGEQAVSEWQGDWLLINYWAIWCKPCIKEIPELNVVDRKEGVSMLGYNFDALQGDALSKQASDLGIEFPLVTQDPASLFEQERPSALPATMIIDPQGQFRRWLMGPQTAETIMAAISALPETL